VVDSFSTDNTVEIAKSLSAQVYQNKFIHHAQQFQWALDNCEFTTDWVMKLDADEIITSELATELENISLDSLGDINGFQVKCRVHFMGKWIRRGYYPMVLYRIFNRKKAYMEQRWMDEHIRLKDGRWKLLDNDIIDENLNTLSWWTSKHNAYSTKEAMMRLHYETPFLSDAPVLGRGKKLYLVFPKFIRAAIYFIYRYFFRLGFLDGKAGFIWHFLQGLWYQILVDAKMVQIQYLAKMENKTIKTILEEKFDINFSS
jgi:glycosyltransferase involved in cell wall biosynthesis